MLQHDNYCSKQNRKKMDNYYNVYSLRIKLWVDNKTWKQVVDRKEEHYLKKC